MAPYKFTRSDSSKGGKAKAAKYRRAGKMAKGVLSKKRQRQTNKFDYYDPRQVQTVFNKGWSK